MEKELAAFLEDLKNRKKMSVNTCKSYESDLRKFVRFMASLDITDITQVDETRLNSYFLYMEKKNPSPATILRQITSLRAFYRYLLRERLVDRDITEHLKKPENVRKMPVVLTEEEVDRLIEAPMADTKKGIRDAAILELLYATGIKVSELISLKRKDVNLLLNFVHLGESEAKERTIPFGEHARAALLKYMEDVMESIAGDGDYLFYNLRGGKLSRQSVWKMLKEYAAKAGIEKEITPHTLRHTFAAHILAHGGDFKSVQEMLGHADISTTQMYAGFRKNRIREVYTKTHPRG